MFHVLQRQEVNVEKYWRHEFTSVMTSRELTRYVVLSVEPVLRTDRASAKKRGQTRKLQLCECIVAKESDMGVNDRQYTCLSHLGSILKEGHLVLGYVDNVV